MTRLMILLCPLALLAASCGPTVDCEALCERTLACEVTFVAPDDPDDEKIDSGERTELRSCAYGCEASPLVDVDSARCIDDVQVGDPNECQEPTLDCLGVSAP